MGLTTEVMNYLVSLGYGTPGTNLWRGILQDTPDVAMAIYQYGGAGSTPGFNVPGVKEDMPGIQIKTRGIAFDYDGPEVRCLNAARDLVKVQAQLLSGTKYRMIRMQQSVPSVFERDTKNRVIFVISLLAEREVA